MVIATASPDKFPKAVTKVSSILSMLKIRIKTLSKYKNYNDHLGNHRIYQHDYQAGVTPHKNPCIERLFNLPTRSLNVQKNVNK